MKLVLKNDLLIKNSILVKDVNISAEWRYKQSLIDEFAEKKSLYFTQDLYLRNVVSEPRYKRLKDLLPRVINLDVEDNLDKLIKLCSSKKINQKDILLLVNEIQGKKNGDNLINNLFADGWGSNEDADEEQRKIFGKKVFDYPKPSKLITKLLASTRMKNAVILDFFAGSGTTGHAVLKLNQKDKGKRQFILATNNENKIAEKVTYPRIKKIVSGYAGEKGIPANVRYFKTSFVLKNKVSDDTRWELVKRSTEMICVRENTFLKKHDNRKYKLYTNGHITTGILFDLDSIDELKEKIESLKLPSMIYVFSLTNDSYANDFVDLKVEHKLCPIPESILEVYRKLFG